MNKVAKRFFTLLAMMLLVITSIPKAVSATEVKDDEKNVIYIQVPDDWSNPCVWAWDDDGTNAFETWPGEEAEADPVNEGWYYTWIPSWATHVIVNGNEGQVQTDEQIIDGTNAWISIRKAGEVEVSYEQQTTGDIPEYVEKFVVHAQVDASWENPCIWAWSAPDGTNAYETWPGYELSDDGDGWHSAKIPVWVNSIIINANEGTVQTQDISVDAAEVWVTVDAEGQSDFSYVDPNKEEVPNVTVHVAAPADWEAPCIWAWSAPDGTNVYSTWPGEALEEGERGWLAKEIPGWVNSIIVNANEGSVQTQDVSIETGKEIWLMVTDSETYEVFYEEPAITANAGAEEVTAETEETVDAVEVVNTESAETENQAEAGGMNTAAVIVVTVIAVLAVAAIIVMLVKKNKK